MLLLVPSILLFLDLGIIGFDRSCEDERSRKCRKSDTGLLKCGEQGVNRSVKDGESRYNGRFISGCIRAEGYVSLALNHIWRCQVVRSDP